MNTTADDSEQFLTEEDFAFEVAIIGTHAPESANQSYLCSAITFCASCGITTECWTCKICV